MERRRLALRHPYSPPILSPFEGTGLHCFTSRSVSGFVRTSSSYASSEASLATTRSRSDILRAACFDMLIDVDGIISNCAKVVPSVFKRTIKSSL